MNLKITLILLFALILIRPTNAFAQEDEDSIDSVICWREDVKLKWKDFLEKEDPESTVIQALTCAQIEVLPIRTSKGALTYTVVNKFIKKCSWVKDTLYILSKYSLEHEQLHFDISELYARKIRCKISEFSLQKKELNVPEFSIEMDKLFNESENQQDLYDKETSHGTIRAKQVEWQDKVQKELKKLRKYKSTIEDCTY